MPRTALTYGGSAGPGVDPRLNVRPTSQRPASGYSGSTGGSHAPAAYTPPPQPGLTSNNLASYANNPWLNQILDPNRTPGGGVGVGAGPPGPVGPDLDALQAAEIAAAQQALAAKYGAARGSLVTDKKLLGLDYRANQAFSERQQETDLEDSLNSFAGRGTARSGFALQEQGQIVTAASTGRAQATAQFRAERGAILQALNQGLIDQREAEEAQQIAAINATYAMYKLNQPQD